MLYNLIIIFHGESGLEFEKIIEDFDIFNNILNYIIEFKNYILYFLFFIHNIIKKFIYINYNIL